MTMEVSNWCKMRETGKGEKRERRTEGGLPPFRRQRESLLPSPDSSRSPLLTRTSPLARTPAASRDRCKVGKSCVGAVREPPAAASYILIAAILLLGVWARAASAEEAAPKPEEFVKAAADMKTELGDGFIIERAGLFVVAGDLPRRQFDRYKTRTVANCAAALWTDFFETKPDYPIRVYLFRGKASYEKWVPKLAGFKPHTPYGFYLPSRKALMMNIGTGGGTLVHEMTHALMDPDFPNCPTWLFEGLGSLYEQCSLTRDGHIRGHVNWRLPVLRRGGFIPLKTLITMSDDDFRGDREPLHYANARYLCFYLQQRGLLTKFYKTFREAHKAGTDKTGWDSFRLVIGEPVDAFEKKWHAWIKTLKWPPR